MTYSIKHRGLTVGVLFAAIAQVLWPAPAQAQNMPSGVISTAGPAPTIGTSGTTTTVTLTGPRAIINWDSFNVGAGYTFEVIGASTSDILLNRVLGTGPSFITGLVQSNANVWLLNPNGIFVNRTGRFDVGGLLLSTAGLADADFLDGNLDFSFSGTSTTPLVIYPTARLQANTGSIVLLANQVSTSGSLTSAGSNMLFGARAVSVTFDADLGAVTTYTVDLPSTAQWGVSANPGASFSGNRTLLMSAGMSLGQGNVILNNAGGANDVVFHDGSVELVSTTEHVIARGTFTTPGDLTVNAAKMFQGNGGPTVSGDYSITAQDFSGGVFNPVFVGTDNDFSITDTGGGLTIGNITAPGDLNVTVSGGSLYTNSTFGSPTSTNGNMSLSADGDILIGGNLYAQAPGGSISLAAGGAIIQSAGAIITDTVYASAGYHIQLDGMNLWRAASFTNSDAGARIFANSLLAWDLLGASSQGILSLHGPSIGVSGNVQSVGEMILQGDVVVNGDTTLRSATGDVSLRGAVDGGAGSSNLSIEAAGGTTINGNVGAATALTSLTVVGDSTFYGTSLRTVGAVDLDDATIGAVGGTFQVTAGGAFSAASLLAADSSIRVNARGIQAGSIRAGDNAGTARSVRLDSGVGNIQLGSVHAGQFHATGSGDLAVSGPLETLAFSGFMAGIATLEGDNQIDSIGTFTSRGLSLRNLGDLAVDDVVNANAGDVRIDVVGGDLQVNAAGAIRGNDIAVSSDSFVNLSGADALDAAGHWVVYQQLPLLTDYQGLDSGNTALWGATLATLDPAAVSGNRYVFAFTPTLTFTTIDASKVYGTDLTGATSGLFSVTGYQPGVAGAYLADTAATAFSGAPLVTSAGLAERASVAGGPYALDITNGSLASASGYQFAFDGAGSLTITPKALTGTASTATKTYDGTTDASGTIALSGVVAGDTVGASGTFTFVDKNAGTGKTVTIAGAALSGADAGNYTLTIPASTIGDILQKAISGTATADSKTYDGTTDGSGTITLTGVVAGDDLGADGTFTFIDEHAGTGKTVTLSGVTLTGADAGNYTLTVPASLLGDILRKAITGTVTVGTKTYDGTTDAAGTVTLAGVVAGDDVAGSATFAFIDKHAGSNKTVTVSGASLSGADAGNYTVTLPATALADILQKAISGTVAADSKTYDGTTGASGSVALTGVVAGDDVDGSATFTFTDKNAGTNKTVTVSGGTLAGADAGNYTLTLPSSALADILQKAITGTVAADSKTYDGTTGTSGSVALTGVVAGDDVDGSATFTFTDKNAGTNKTVTISGATLSGTDAGNYTVTLPATALADILQKAITGTVAADSKTYDGTTGASGSVALTGVVAGDDVDGSATFTFTDKNAGTNKTVTVSGATLSGTDAGNYTVTLPATALADILQRAITGTVAADSKTYDGTTDASGSVALTGVVAGDDVDGSATFTFADKNAGTNKTVTVSGATLSGTDAGNYTVTLPATALADILQKAITGTAAADDKTYDGTTGASGSVALTGVVAGDDVDGSATFTFTDKNAGTNKTVTISGATLSGADAGNYTVTLPATALADILQKAITGTVAADSKTYDGTAGTSGSVALTGVVAGDDVNGSATFTFTDKNAGTNKTVTISGATLSGTDAGNYTVTLPATALADILQKAITGTVAADSKTYDGTTGASGSVALTGIVAGDDVDGSATFTFTDKNAGTNKTVTVSGATLSGTDAGNYTVTLPATALADILQKAITGTVAADSKTYDGTTDASGSVALTGVVAGDDVDGSATFTFADKNAGTNKTVTVSGATLSGTDAGNYTVTLPATALADILQKAITGTVAANDKTYDGSTSGNGSVSLTGVVAGDDVDGSATFTFTDKNAGTNKTVTVSGATLSGSDAGNYTVTLPATALADILQKTITGSVAANDKTYDGSTSGTGSVALTGVVAGDDVDGSATFTFTDKNAGTNKTVTVSGATLSGTDAGNYTVTLPATALADILQKAITGTATADDKTYDGSTAATGSIALDGVVAGDSVGAAGTFAFVDKNAGTGKQVTVSGVTLSGADAGNYTITVPASTVADILRKTINGTAMVDDKTYDGTRTATGSITLDGVVAGDDVDASGSYTFSDANAGEGKAVAVDDVTLDGVDADNYTVVVSGSTVADILRRAITVTADSLTKPEGAADPALTYAITEGSLVSGESLSGSLDRADGEAPGQYAIGQGTLDASANYQLSFVGSTLTITAVGTDPTDGLVVQDQMGGVMRFLFGLAAATGAGAPPLEIVDERLECDEESPSGACPAPRRD